MRRAIGLLTIVGALGLAPGAASAAGTDFASGSASYVCGGTGCGADVAFTGHGTPADAWGTMKVNLDEGVVRSRGSVDCVAVAGKRAVISGVLENPHPGLEGPFYSVIVDDNGPARPGSANPDRLSFATARFPVTCELGLEFPATFPVSRGNIVVRDYTP